MTMNGCRRRKRVGVVGECDECLVKFVDQVLRAPVLVFYAVND